MDWSNPFETVLYTLRNQIPQNAAFQMSFPNFSMTFLTSLIFLFLFFHLDELIF